MLFRGGCGTDHNLSVGYSRSWLNLNTHDLIGHKPVNQPYLFIAAEVAYYFKLSDRDGQAALRQAGYVADQRSHKGQKIRCWVQPKHLQHKGIAFSLWTPNSDSCPTIRDAPDLLVVK